jgi:hypothetical protein
MTLSQLADSANAHWTRTIVGFMRVEFGRVTRNDSDGSKPRVDPIAITGGRRRPHSAGTADEGSWSPFSDWGRDYLAD